MAASAAPLRPAALAAVAVLIVLASRSATGLEILYDGCERVMAGPVCVLGERGQIHVWLEQSAAMGLVWYADEQRVTAATERTVASGWRYTFQLEPQHRSLRAQNPSGQSLFTLKLAPMTRHAVWATANQKLRDGEHRAALAALDEALSELDVDFPAHLLHARARAYTRLGERAASRQNLGAAMSAALVTGEVSARVNAAVALAFSLREDQGDLTAAAAVLDSVEQLGMQHASSLYLLHYHRAMIAFRRGNVREHLRLMYDAAILAERFEWTRRQVHVDSRRAVQWQQLGQRERAIAILDSWRDRLPENYPDYDRAVFWTNLGWAYLLALEAQDIAPDPLPVLRRALALALAHAPATEKTNAWINLGLGLWHAGDLDGAQDALHASHIPGTTSSPRLQHWATDLEARIAAGRGDMERALELYAQLAQRAEKLNDPHTVWRAHARRAWVFESVGDVAGALREHERADRLLDLQIRQVPLQQGRETFLATRRFATLQRVGLLLREKDNAGALAVVRTAQARSLRLAHVAASVAKHGTDQRPGWQEERRRYRALRNQLQQRQRDSWMLTRDEMVALAAHTEHASKHSAMLLDSAVMQATDHARADVAPLELPSGRAHVAFTRTANGWAVLVDDGRQTLAWQPACATTSKVQVAACLLKAAQPTLTDSADIELTVDAELGAVDFASLPFRDSTWVTHATLRYVASLPPTTRRTPVPGGALLVGDPTGNLNAARREIDGIEPLFQRAPDWQPTTLSGDQATSLALRDRLEDVALLHYAGHASFGDASGWDSALHLAHGTSLNVGDILTLERVPQVVVLSGCETAGRPDMTIPSMSLANAFLAAGASTVIATARAVDDVSAAAMTRAFYAHWFDGKEAAAALRAAQINIQQTRPHLDWAAFRLFEP